MSQALTMFCTIQVNRMTDTKQLDNIEIPFI